MNNNGRIDITLETATVEDVLALLEQVKGKLGFLVRLDSQEKMRMPKARAGSNEVADELLDLQTEAGIPQLAEDPLIADLSVSRGLARVEAAMSDIMARIKDTRYLAASEAWCECLVRYGTLRQMSRSKPQLRKRLDRLQPLIAGRRARRSAQPAQDTKTEPDDAK